MANQPQPSGSSGKKWPDLLDQLGTAILRRPAIFAVVVLAGLIGLPFAVWMDMRNLSEETLTRQAAELNSIISDIRSYYASNVIGRVLQNHGEAKPTHDYPDVPGGIPIPATLSIELGEVVGKKNFGVEYRFVSDVPFKGRAEHKLDGFETDALATFREKPSADAIDVRTTGNLFNRRVQMAVPIMMGAACVSCHNTHPLSTKTDWKVGDVRGIQSITIQQPIAANIFSFRYLIGYFILAGLAGLLFLVVQGRQARQFAAMNTELEDTNAFLAGVSMKISKYLSPQVYRSIFSGEKDAVISTERKKLTIFFSDIKDFTVTTERLQPEELTRLLNEYFTEMAVIAELHGATVDKFIGDAILAFFGDPVSKGAKEDALQCVRMALAMQTRMDELAEQWRKRGIDKPIRVRMGINTGYCNVGNFGSSDRMDYTIIGAEANLAARLESIAEPGGIVMSYETYALVQDEISATPLDPITLKGISREIVPYVVDGRRIPAEAEEPGKLQLRPDGIDLSLNLAGLDPVTRAKIEEAAAHLVNSVRQSRT